MTYVLTIDGRVSVSVEIEEPAEELFNPRIFLFPGPPHKVQSMGAAVKATSCPNVTNRSSFISRVI